MAVIFTLKASDQKKVLSLSNDVICSETGLESVLKRLDKLYLEDETLEMYRALEDFEAFKRQSSIPINDLEPKWNWHQNSQRILPYDIHNLNWPFCLRYTQQFGVRPVLLTGTRREQI